MRNLCVKPAIKKLLLFLRIVVKRSLQFFRQPADAGRGFSPSGEQETFLIRLLQTIAESQGDPKAVYPLMRANLALLNIELVQILNQWWEGVLANVGQNHKEGLAGVLVNLGVFIGEFPLGSPATNQQIAIAAYNNALLVYTKEEQPQDWARTKGNLGHTYRKLATFSANPGDQI